MAPIVEPDRVWPLVSVVVPTVDRPELLHRAVRSIVRQHHPGPIELLVVFDRTAPRPPELDLPPNRTIRTLVNDRGPGLPGTRNTGYLAAKGEYLAACDDDDEWHPAKIGAQLRRFDECPGAVLCATGLRIVRGARTFERRAPAAGVTLDDLLRHRHVEICPSSSLFRRGLVDAGVLVDEDIPGGYAEDYEWLLRVVRVGPIVGVPEALTFIHWHDDSHFVGEWSTIEQGLSYLLATVPELREHRAGRARIEGQLALAHAAMGERRTAWRLARRSLQGSWRVRQAYAALLVMTGLVSADRVALTARRFGLGT